MYLLEWRWALLKYNNLLHFAWPWFWRLLLLYTNTGMHWCVALNNLDWYIKSLMTQWEVEVEDPFRNNQQRMHWSWFESASTKLKHSLNYYILIIIGIEFLPRIIWKNCSIIFSQNILNQHLNTLRINVNFLWCMMGDSGMWKNLNSLPHLKNPRLKWKPKRR